MIEQETPPCTLGLDSATLSALRDGSLPTDELRRLNEHAATCLACQQRLADFDHIQRALRRAPELEPGNRIWHGVQERVTRSTENHHPRPPIRLSASAMRSLAAVASLALVVALLGVVLAEAAGNRGGSASPAGQITGPGKPTRPVATQWQKPTFTATSPWGTPTPTLPPTTPAITPQQAWGPNAAVMTINTQLDATHVFHATAISPDGQYLLGYAYEVPTSYSSTPADAGYYDITTRQFTSIGVTQSSNYPPDCCTMDGHYLLVTEDTAPGTTCGLCHLAYDVFDLDTKSLWQFAKGTDYGMVGRALDNHGLVILSTGQGIQVVDLATKHIAPLQVPVSNAMEVDVLAYTWPYIVYTYSVAGANGVPNPGHFRAHDLSSNQDIELPQTDALLNYGSMPDAIVGQTWFLTVAVSNDPHRDASETSLYEDDAFFSSDSAPRLLASFNSGELFTTAANSRLVDLGAGVVWDRAQRRFVQLVPSTYADSPWLFKESLVGHWLATMQLADPNGSSQAQQVTIYDTDTLPTTPSA